MVNHDVVRILHLHLFIYEEPNPYRTSIFQQMTTRFAHSQFIIHIILYPSTFWSICLHSWPHKLDQCSPLLLDLFLALLLSVNLCFYYNMMVYFIPSSLISFLLSPIMLWIGMEVLVYIINKEGCQVAKYHFWNWKHYQIRTPVESDQFINL